MVTLAAAAWGGTTLTWREKQTLSFSRGDVRRLFSFFFLTLLKVRKNEFPERDPRDFGLLAFI